MKEEIMNRIAEAVKEKIGTECDIEFKEARKNNGIMLQGMLIRKHGETVFKNIYIDNLIDRIEQCSTGVQDAAEEIVRIFNENQRSGELAGIVRSLNKEEILKKAVYQVIGKERNMDMLADVPHKELLDLAAVYRVVLDESSDETLSFLLTNSLCREYGIDSEELERAAGRNTEMRGFVTINFASVVAENAGIPQELSEADLPPLYVLTNKTRVNGAAVMLYWNYFEKLAHKLQSDLYILPSSVHEVLAVPASIGDPRELKDMVREINAGGIIADDEILSDNVYFYNLKKGGLYIA